MTHDVFISYSSKDKPIADGVCANLEATGVRCWIAPRDIAPGADWPGEIAQAITQSRIMVLVFSANSNSSEDVGRELILAANSKLVIIPFKIENVEPEPGKQYYLARTHWLDAMNPPTRDQIAILVNRVKSILSATVPGETNQAETGPVSLPLSNKIQLKRLPIWAAGAVIMFGLFVWISAGGLSKFNALPTPTAVANTPVPTQTYLPAPTATELPVLTPTSFPASTSTASSDVLFSSDFNDSAFNDRFDPGEWFLRPDIKFTSIKQTNGVMVFSKQSTTGVESANLGTNQSWSLGEFSYIESRLKLDQEHIGENGNVGFTLSDSKYWWAGCGIQAANPTPFFWCGQGAQNGFDYMSDSYYLAYDRWYTVRVEFNNQTNEFQGYIDGKSFYSWRPANISELRKKKFLVTVGIWSDNGSMVTGYADDVSVIK